MDKIVGQAAAEDRREQAAAQRQQEFAKVKTIAGALLVAAVLGFAVTHMSEIQGVVNAHLAKKSSALSAESLTGGKIDQIQQSAEKRDAIVDEVTK